MTAEKEANHPVERLPRVEMTNGRRANVVIKRATAHGPEQVRGDLVDISRGGAKLALNSSVPFNEPLTFSIAIPELDLEFEVVADVSWSRQGEGGTWLVGCCFNPGLPDDTVDQLARSGYLERRRNPRYPLTCAGTARWELSTKTDAVCLEDFSLDGFCMLCSKSIEAGRRFQLELDGDPRPTITIPARTQWHARAEEGYLIGCAFLNPRDFHTLWEFAHELSPNEPLRTRVQLPQSRWLLAWFAALVAFIVLYPPLVRLLTDYRSMAAEWGTPGAAAARPPADADAPKGPQPSAKTEPPQPDTKGAEPAGSGPPESAVRPDADRTAEAKNAASDRLEEERQGLRAEKDAWWAAREHEQAELAARARALADQSARLAAQEAAIQTDQAAWTQQLKQRLAAVESDRLQLEADKAAWQSKQRLRSARVAPPPPTRPTVDRTPNSTPPAARSSEPHDNVSPPEAEQEPTERTNATAPPAATPSVTADVPDREAALVAFRRGRAQLEQHQYVQAAAALRTAVADDAGNPLYHYLLAMAEYQTGERAAAERRVHQAVALERDRPINNWGGVMSRYQGAGRLWLERARRSAAKPTAERPLAG